MYKRQLTSIVGYISIEDLTKAWDIIRSRTFDAFFPLLATAAIYFAISSLIIFAVGRLEIDIDQMCIRDRGKLKLGPKMWELFNQKDPRQHHWYYRSIACALESLADTPAWREYDWLIGQVFEEGDEGPSPGRPEETAKEEE